MSLKDARIIELPKISDPRGNLTFIEQTNHIPFEIKRVYYLYDVPEAASRGAHAHKAQHEFLIPISGSFDVIVKDSSDQVKFRLDKPNCGLYLPEMTWRDLDNFSTNSICLVLSSGPFDESDYIRDYNEFLKEIEGI